MPQLVRLRNLYIARLVLVGVSHKAAGELYGITGARVGVLVHGVLKKLCPDYSPGDSNGKDEQHEPRAVAKFINTHSNHALRLIHDYEKKHYPAEHIMIRAQSTSKDVIMAIKQLSK